MYVNFIGISGSLVISYIRNSVMQLTYLKQKGILLTSGYDLAHFILPMKQTNPPFLNGIPELIVLRLLERKEMYGYELIKAIQAESKGAFSFGEGCIYPVLHYLEQSKWVTSRRQDVNGRSRLYYRITPRGRKRMAAMAGDWNNVAAGVAMVLGGQHA